MSRTSNLVISSICGVLFAAGWWIFIDGFSYADANGNNAGPFYMYLPTIFATIGLFLFNNIRDEVFQSGTSAEDIEWWEKLLIVISCVFHLAAIIESIWVYLGKDDVRSSNIKKWRGISSIISAVLITLASFAWRLLYKDPDAF